MKSNWDKYSLEYKAAFIVGALTLFMDKWTLGLVPAKAMAILFLVLVAVALAFLFLYKKRRVPSISVKPRVFAMSVISATFIVLFGMLLTSLVLNKGFSSDLIDRVLNISISEIIQVASNQAWTPYYLFLSLAFMLNPLVGLGLIKVYEE